jgi:ATP-binding cassette subfamily B protein
LLAGLVLANMLVAMIQLVEPLLFGRVVDALALHQDAMPLVAIWAVAGLLGMLVAVMLAVHADRLSHRLRLAMLDEAFQKALHASPEIACEGGSSAVMRILIAGVDALFWLWLNVLREHCAALLHVLMLLPLALFMQPVLACILYVMSGIYAFANVSIARHSAARQSIVENFQHHLFGRMGDVLANTTVLQSFSRIARESADLQAMMQRLLQAQYPVLTWWALVTVFTRISATLTMLALFAAGSFLVAAGQVTVGNLVSFVSFATLLIAHLDQLSGFFARTLNQSSVLPAFFELVDRAPDYPDDPDASVLRIDRGVVSFEHVSFHYPDSSHGVYDLSFTARRGQTVALVGSSGSGKTTTMKLLQRFRFPDSGVIRIDGQDIRRVTLVSLRQAIAVVFQDAFLLNRSIGENIALADADAPRSSLERYAMMANAHAFIMEKSGQYDFVVGERGAALSGGERQRLAIARALLKQAPVLVLDEATSALDQVTENGIQLAISELRKNHTLFVIAHRISTVANADLILVFDQGRIIERGTFDELMAKQGRFCEFVRTMKG